jgi:hypothetical protein
MSTKKFTDKQLMELAVKTYDSGEWQPEPGTWYERDPNATCVLGAVLLALGVPVSMLTPNSAVQRLNRSCMWVEGVLHAFDDEGRDPSSNAMSADYRAGYRFGLRAAKKFLPVPRE